MFPQFNIHSTPLLILVLQGLIFAVLLLLRWRSQRRDADLLIALLLIAMAWHRTTYTIGFMGWYDTFKNTKVNYYLVYFGLGIGPLIYLYVRSITKSPFKLQKRDIWHFVPVCIYFVFKVVVLLHDAMQPGWEIGYGGEWKSGFEEPYVDPFHEQLSHTSRLIYLVFTLQLFWNYRKKIQQNFSNTYKVELNWIRNFLLIYLVLFMYGSITTVIALAITDLDYVHRWWMHLFSAIAIVYLGMKAYYTDLRGLYDLTFGMVDSQPIALQHGSKEYDLKKKEKLQQYIEGHRDYLNPDLSLRELSKRSGISLHDLSETINSGYGVNFNEFINGFRVEEVKRRLLDEKNAHLSILAIAMDSGFKSKATFNRVFKSMTQQSPSEFRTKNQ